MRRSDREVTDPREIRAAISRFRVCRLGLGAEGEMRIVPMCFGYRDGFLYFHSACEGEKIHILRSFPRVVFEMDHILEVVDEDDIHFESLAGQGTVEFLESPDEKRDGIQVLLRSFSGVEGNVSDRAIAATCVFRVGISGVSMKRNPASWKKPVLETERLILRTLGTGDSETLEKAGELITIVRTILPFPDTMSLYDPETFIDRRLNDFLGKTGGVFGIVEKTTGGLSGFIGISPDRPGSADIGFWMNPSKRGMGYCPEALRRVIAFGFKEMGLVRITAVEQPHYPLSAEILERAGMVREGTLRKYLIRNGVPMDAGLWAAVSGD